MEGSAETPTEAPPSLGRRLRRGRVAAARRLMRARRFALVEVLVQALQAIGRDRLLVQASALTFLSLLNLVPVLAFVFAVAKGLGFQRLLEPLILERISVGSEEVARRILTYIDNTNVASLGVVGMLALLATVILVLSNIERGFNHIWGIARSRSVGRKFSDFLSVVLVFPFLLLAASSVNLFVESRPIILDRLLAFTLMATVWSAALGLAPYLFMAAGLTFLYVFMPNTRVRFSAALFGGGVAGIALQAAQDLYIHFQIGMAKYNAIYGAMAQLPVFLVWIYISWIIVLFGAELSWSFQQEQSRRRVSAHRLPDASVWECIHLEVLRVVAQRYQEGKGATACAHVVAATGLPAESCAGILNNLTDAGVLLADGCDPEGYVPATPPDHTTLFDVRAALQPHLGDGLMAAVTPTLGTALAAGQEVTGMRTTVGDLFPPPVKEP